MSDLLERMFGQMPGSEYRGYNVGYGNSDPMKALFPRQQQEPAKKWWAQDVQERQKTLSGEQEKLAGLQQKTGLKEAFKPILNVLQVVGGVLNIPGAAISSAVKQLVDGAPGFNTQEYFQGIFNFKQQASWRDIIGLLAERDPDKNVWDKKWAQITAGLILDIALDPTTYFGKWPIGKLSKMQSEGMEALTRLGNQVLKNHDEANRLFNIAMREGTKGWGIKLPFVKKPLAIWQSARGKTMLNTAESLGKVASIAGQETVKDIMPDVVRILQPLLQKKNLYDFITSTARKFVPGFKWAEQAFNPYAHVHRELLQENLRLQNFANEELFDIQKQVTELAKNLDNKTLVNMTGVLQDLPVLSPEIVAKNIEMMHTLAKFIRKYEKSDKGWQKISSALFKEKEDLNKLFRQRLGKELTAAGKQKLSPIQIISKFDDMMDTGTARQLQGYFKRANMEVGDLVTLAKYKTNIDVVELFKKIGKGLSTPQKEAILAFTTRQREMLDDWWDLEFKAGKIDKYVRDYSMHPVGGKKGRPAMPMLTSVFPSGMPRLSNIPYEDRFNSAIKTLRDMGIARSDNHAKEILRSGKSEDFGTMVETISEQLMVRGQGHVKAMHKAKLLDEAKLFGTQWEKRVPPPYHMARSSIKELEGYIFDLDTKQWLENAHGLFGNERTIGTFLRGIDKVQGWWKRLVLLYPGYHFRNMYGNHSIGFVKQGTSWFTDIGKQKDALASVLQTVVEREPTIKKYSKEIFDFFGVGEKRLAGRKLRGRTLLDINKELNTYDLIKGYSRQTDTAALQGVARINKDIKKWAKKINLADPENVIGILSDRIGGIIESQARVTNFYHDFDRLGSVRLAVQETQEAFVDYNNITTFEKEIMRRVVPFWTWLSRNLKNQIRFVFTQPGKMAAMPRVANAVEVGAGWKMPEDERPGYFNGTSSRIT